ncbi:MAG: DUF6036 family nucleotidyltransferase [Defluviitaleaceae bacterium]|nr:DUF6036 family nucleotidyltransferase [Defluviitaleaceae bacterium]
MDENLNPLLNKKLSAGKIELTKEDVIQILGCIDEELRNEGLSATAIIYGGCAMMLHGYDTRATTDIDYIVKDVPLADFSRIIDRVVEKSNPPFKRSLFDITMGVLIAEHFKLNELKELNLFSNLHVSVATVRQLLAMKLFSARMGTEFHDLADALHLAKELGLRSAIELKDTMLDYVEKTSVDKINKDARNPNAIDRFILEVEKRLV